MVSRRYVGRIVVVVDGICVVTAGFGGGSEPVGEK